MTKHLEKFQVLLRELFQFDCADLDFGIYRIMNHKRDVIERFIAEDLPRGIAAELDSGSLAEQSQVAEKLHEIRQQIQQNLGKEAVDADGNLAEPYRSTPLGKEYLKLKAQCAAGFDRAALQAAIFNHLHAFFSRYYQEGDFISKRRYSKHQRYAIPYNGEEVHLHWANSDQYYIKTGEHFLDYSFAARDIAVHFTLKVVDVEQDNVKGEKRVFLPCPQGLTWDAVAKRLDFPFEYRPLTEQEAMTYGKKNQQETIITEALVELPKQLHTARDALAALTAERRRNDDGKAVSYLEHHLRQYTRRNTSDFFIHKDLKGFLLRELDFYLKNEVLKLGDMEVAGEDRAEGWFQLMRTIRSVGGQIIEFLDQIESFQRMLWEKRKFVTETQYCIALGHIDEGFHEEIAACEAQWEEWKALGVDEDTVDLFSAGKDRTGKRLEFLNSHPTLVLDTKHFRQDFVDQLLGCFDDLDGMTDGVLIHGSNYQALRLLETRYRRKVDCIYLDPPFNTSETSLLYKNEYRHSSWMTLMQQGLLCARETMNEASVLAVAIDDYENENLSKCLESALGSEGRLGTLVVETKPSGRTNDRFLATCHEYYHFFGLEQTQAEVAFFPLSDEAQAEYGEVDGIGALKWRDFLRTGGFSTPEERPNSYYPIYYDPESKDVGVEAFSGAIEILPIDSHGKRRVWRKTKPSFLSHVAKGEIRIEERRSGTLKVLLVDRIKQGTRPKSVWVGSRYDAASHGTKLLKSLFVDSVFDFPKALGATEDVIFVAMGAKVDGEVLDYFAGSGTTGHAVINLNRGDGGRRRFILVEVGDHFDTVLLPRIKKVAFAPDWKDGKPKRTATSQESDRGPRIVKYLRLESYEDALNNIDFAEGAAQDAFQFDDFLLKYMLQWETKRSATLLNVEKLSQPFHYALNIHTDGRTGQQIADIPETFSYLLGLRVDTRRVCHDDGRRYLVYRGMIDQRRVVVIWRDTHNWNKAALVRDKEFVAEQRLTTDADEVYINGDSLIREARSLEPEFKRRMFAGPRA